MVALHVRGISLCLVLFSFWNLMHSLIIGISLIKEVNLFLHLLIQYLLSTRLDARGTKKRTRPCPRGYVVQEAGGRLVRRQTTVYLMPP